MTVELCAPEEDAAEALGNAEFLPMERLRPGDSPRLNGLSRRHAEMLAESGQELPAILVQKGTMRVIDGMHRLHAARLRGLDTIAVRLADVDDDVAFLMAVESNIEHGLPLSLADRKAAASRIIEARPYWSDRAIAQASGLSWKTVGVLRARAQAPSDAARRVGRDGKVRPVSGAAGRQLAGQLLARNPGAGLREIARAAGVSAATVRDVRDRLSQGKDVLTPAQQRHLAAAPGEAGARPAIARAAPPRPATALAVVTSAARPGGRPQPASPARRETLDCTVVVDKLKTDPSLRYSNSGRALLYLLQARPSALPTTRVIAALPAYCLNMIAQVSRRIAVDWMDFAAAIEERHRAEAELDEPSRTA